MYMCFRISFRDCVCSLSDIFFDFLRTHVFSEMSNIFQPYLFHLWLNKTHVLLPGLCLISRHLLWGSTFAVPFEPLKIALYFNFINYLQRRKPLPWTFWVKTFAGGTTVVLLRPDRCMTHATSFGLRLASTSIIHHRAPPYIQLYLTRRP